MNHLFHSILSAVLSGCLIATSIPVSAFSNPPPSDPTLSVSVRSQALNATAAWMIGVLSPTGTLWGNRQEAATLAFISNSSLGRTYRRLDEAPAAGWINKMGRLLIGGLVGVTETVTYLLIPVSLSLAEDFVWLLMNRFAANSSNEKTSVLFWGALEERSRHKLDLLVRQWVANHRDHLFTGKKGASVSTEDDPWENALAQVETRIQSFVQPLKRGMPIVVFQPAFLILAAMATPFLSTHGRWQVFIGVFLPFIWTMGAAALKHVSHNVSAIWGDDISRILAIADEDGPLISQLASQLEKGVFARRVVLVPKKVTVLVGAITKGTRPLIINNDLYSLNVTTYQLTPVNSQRNSAQYGPTISFVGDAAFLTVTDSGERYPLELPQGNVLVIPNERIERERVYLSPVPSEDMTTVRFAIAIGKYQTPDPLFELRIVEQNGEKIIELSHLPLAHVSVARYPDMNLSGLPLNKLVFDAWNGAELRFHVKQVDRFGLPPSEEPVSGGVQVKPHESPTHPAVASNDFSQQHSWVELDLDLLSDLIHQELDSPAVVNGLPIEIAARRLDICSRWASEILALNNLPLYEHFLEDLFRFGAVEIAGAVEAPFREDLDWKLSKINFSGVWHSYVDKLKAARMYTTHVRTSTHLGVFEGRGRPTPQSRAAKVRKTHPAPQNALDPELSAAVKLLKDDQQQRIPMWDSGPMNEIQERLPVLLNPQAANLQGRLLFVKRYVETCAGQHLWGHAARGAVAYANFFEQCELEESTFIKELIFLAEAQRYVAHMIMTYAPREYFDEYFPAIFHRTGALLEHIPETLNSRTQKLHREYRELKETIEFHQNELDTVGTFLTKVRPGLPPAELENYIRNKAPFIETFWYVWCPLLAGFTVGAFSGMSFAFSVTDSDWGSWQFLGVMWIGAALGGGLATLIGAKDFKDAHAWIYKIIAGRIQAVQASSAEKKRIFWKGVQYAGWLYGFGSLAIGFGFAGFIGWWVVFGPLALISGVIGLILPLARHRDHNNELYDRFLKSAAQVEGLFFHTRAASTKRSKKWTSRAA